MRTTNRETYELSISSGEHDNAAISIDTSHRANRPLHVQWGLFFTVIILNRYGKEQFDRLWSPAVP